MIVESLTRSDVLLELDDSTGLARTLSPPEMPDRQICVAGVFGMAAGRVVAVYVDERRLFGRVEAAQFEITPDLTALHRSWVFVSRLIIKRHEQRVLALTYRRAIDVLGWFDGTPFVEDEHHDAGVFLSDLINRPDRQSVIRDRFPRELGNDRDEAPE